MVVAIAVVLVVSGCGSREADGTGQCRRDHPGRNVVGG